MKRLSSNVRRGRERGAVAVILAICMVVVMVGAALGFDIAKLAYERQALRAAIDAAAQAGSYALPDAVAARNDAKDYALRSAPDLNLNRDQVIVQLYCAVSVKAGTTLPDESQVPGICNPGSGWSRGQAATGCNSEMCLLPCADNGSCNTIKVSYEKTVQFMFGPVINIPTGSTGAVSSAACRGVCGKITPNPMNVVVMADRTYSMSSTAVGDLKTGLRNMLTSMTRQHQFVAFGTIHKSITQTVSGQSCLTGVAANDDDLYTADSYTTTTDRWGRTTTTLNDSKRFKGTWVPVGYSSDYTTGSTQTNNLALNTSSTLVKSINCLQHKDNGIGTQLASALKGAAQYVLNDANVTANVSATTIADRNLLERPIRKVIILETDGRPDEVLTSPDSDVTLNNSNDIGASGDGEKGCTNLKKIANQIKALPDNVLIITIGYGDVNYMTCAKKSTSSSNPYGNVTGSSTVKSVLANVASPVNATTPSTADKATCAEENADNDYYFCAANGDELNSIFLTAFSKISGNTKLVKVPGVSD